MWHTRFAQRNVMLSVGAEGRSPHACAQISILSYGASSDVM